jgi:hypothetical protein
MERSEDPSRHSIQADPAGTATRGAEGSDVDQIAERLSWTPAERLRYLVDMLDFEERAHRARPVS